MIALQPAKEDRQPVHPTSVSGGQMLTISRLHLQLHEEEDLKSVWAPDLHENVPARSALFQLLIAAGVAGTFAGLVYFMRASPPALPKAFPREGLADELGGPQVAVSARSRRVIC